MNEFSKQLNQHTALTKRRENAIQKISTVRKELAEKIDHKRYQAYTLYCGGSLGREDIGDKSDLDVFIVSEKTADKIKRMDNIVLFSHLVAINNSLSYPEFSNDAQYLETHSFSDILDHLGSPLDDNKNLFTVRMLLLLESKFAFNEELYRKLIKDTIGKYFRDHHSHKKKFNPMFLINDILRYWRTLCLNYEIIRNDANKPWRKKNINLKFSRMLTIFGTILPIIACKDLDQDYVIQLTKLNPLQRFAQGMDLLDDTSLIRKFQKFLDDYEKFLVYKETLPQELSPNQKSELDTMSEAFSDFIYQALTHRNIERKYIRYLTI